MTAAVRRLVTFGVGSSLYAADIAAVERVLRPEAVHPIPGMPPWMDGVIDHAGRVVPVVDLCRRLVPVHDVSGAAGARSATPEGRAGVTAAPEALSGRLLLLSCDGELLAARVDRVLDVRAVPTADIAPAPMLVHQVAGDFVLGVMRRDAAMVFVLDVARLFTPHERAALRESVETIGAPQPHDTAVP